MGVMRAGNQERAVIPALAVFMPQHRRPCQICGAPTPTLPLERHSGARESANPESLWDLRPYHIEIPRCAIAHLRSGPSDYPGMTRPTKRGPLSRASFIACAVSGYRKLPQKRWMRLQASSRSEVLVAKEMRNAGPSPNAEPCTTA